MEYKTDNEKKLIQIYNRINTNRIGSLSLLIYYEEEAKKLLKQPQVEVSGEALERFEISKEKLRKSIQKQEITLNFLEKHFQIPQLNIGGQN